MDFELTTAIPVLERTPAALEALLVGLPDAWTAVNEGPGSWTVHEIVAHLIHAENDDWLPRTRHLLEWGTSRPFPPFDRTFGFEAARARPLAALVREFGQRRRESLAALSALGLTSAKLAREGRHPEFGGRDAAPAPRDLGRARFHAPLADCASDGGAVPRRGRSVGEIFARGAAALRVAGRG